MLRVLLAAVTLFLVGRLWRSQPPPATNNPGRLASVIPNSRTVEHPQAFAPIKVGTKFKLSAEDAFDPYGFVSAGVNAGVEQARKDHQQYGQGAAGFAKRYGADFADEAISEIFSRGVYPSLFRQDPRYFRLEHGGVWKCSLYAMSRVIWTRDDIGGTRVQQFDGAGRLFGGGDLNSVLPRG